jgi:hypothetical protein
VLDVSKTNAIVSVRIRLRFFIAILLSRLDK